MSSVDELNLASVKISEIQELIDKEQAKKFEQFKILTTTWGSVILTFFLLLYVSAALVVVVVVVSDVGSVSFGFGTNGHPKYAYAIPKNDAAL